MFSTHVGIEITVVAEARTCQVCSPHMWGLKKDIVAVCRAEFMFSTHVGIEKATD